MRRPKYLQDMDDAQDALTEAHPNGLTIRELVKITKRNYAAMQQATVRLYNARRVMRVREGRGFRFYIKE